MSEPIYTHTYYLAAGEGTPEQQMPAGLLFAKCIEVATEHANSLGVGFENLMSHGQTWVLSRMVVEMTSYPAVNENYTIETWVDSFNRAFSDRFFRILDSRGAVCGFARTTWVAIDMQKRTLADISRFDTLRASITAARECPIAPCGRHRPLPDGITPTLTHTFAYSDIDSNRHVNTVRYVEMLMDCWSADFHAAMTPTRIEVTFMRECVYGEQAEITTQSNPAASTTDAQLSVGTERRIHFRIRFEPRERKKF